MDSIILIIFGMAAVTYGPRLAPFLILTDRTPSKRVDAFLRCIPAAAIGALIIPGALTATPNVPLAAMVGMGVTVVFGLWKGGIIIPVLGAVAGTYATLMVWG